MLGAEEYGRILREHAMLDRFVLRISEELPAIVFTALAGAFGLALLAGWL